MGDREETPGKSIDEIYQASNPAPAHRVKSVGDDGERERHHCRPDCNCSNLSAVPKVVQVNPADVAIAWLCAVTATEYPAHRPPSCGYFARAVNDRRGGG